MSRPARRLLLLTIVCAPIGALFGSATASARPQSLPCITTGVVPPLGDCTKPEPALADPPARPDPTPKKRGDCADADLLPASSAADHLADATLCLLNRERARRNLGKLRRNAALDRVATRYARQMVAARFFGHVSPAGTTLRQRVRATPYLDGPSRWRIGENLAWGTGTLGSPARTFRAWMRSAGHRRNMLDPRFREIGIGVAIGIPVSLRNAPTGATYATEFGRREWR